MTTMTARQRVALLLSLMVALLGISVIAGWYLHIPILLQIHPSFVPMRFNTALAFLFGGMALIAWQRSRLGLARILASGVLLIGGLTLWQIATGYDLQIDQLFMQHYVSVKTSSPGRMAPNTALCFVLLGATLLLLASALPVLIKTWINSLLASAILALALIALSGYGLGVETSYGWGNLTRMAVHTAVGFILLGLSLLLSQAAGQRLNPLPAIGIALLVGVLTLWQALRTEQVIALQTVAEHRSEQIQANWQERTELSHQALQRMAARWDGPGASDAAWRIDADNYLKNFGFVALLRYDPSGAVSVLGDARVAAQLLADLPPAACLAGSLPSWQLLPTPSGLADRLAVQVVALSPVSAGSGCIIAVHSLRRQVDRVRQEVLSERYPWTLSVQGQPLYQETSDGPWSTQVALYPPQAGLTLTLTPTQAQAQGSAQPEGVLIVGLVLSSLIILALCLMGVARRQRLQAQLQEGLTLHRGVLANAPYGILLIDHNGAIELINPALGQLFGYSESELIGKPIETLIPLDLHTAHVKQRSAYQNDAGVAKKMATNRQVFGRHRSGDNIAVEVNIAPVNVKGRRSVMAMVVDVRERERALRQIVEQNERFVLASDAARLGFWDYEIVTATLKWDAGMYRLYGQTQRVGDQPYELWAKSLHPDDLARSEQALSDAISGTREFDTEFRIIHPAGAVRSIKAVASVQRDAEGHALKVFGVNFDISEARQAEQQQAALIEQLTRANEELNNFSYVASHDLKSPLRGIDQLASWIAEDLGDRLDGDTTEHLRLMRSRIKRMEMLLDDLLAYSRVGRGNDELVSINTCELVEAVFELQAPNKPMQLLVADDMPVIRGQKVPLELVFRNLIGNAIKHHDKPLGTIRISASKTANAFEFRVQDDGPGIAPEHQQRVFGMFQTLKPRDEIEGSGIGLALVKKAVESVGGSVTLESDGQHGSSFRFTWPTI